MRTAAAWTARHATGLVLVAVVAAAARVLTNLLPPIIGEVTVGIVLGLLFANVISVPASARPGVTFALTRLLRLGIVLLGARLAFGDVLSTGLGALAIIVVGMAAALGFTVVAARTFGLPERLALLIGVGTAVCGNSAIVAAAPAIEAEEREVSFAVATITLFGTLAVLTYPLIGHLLGFSDRVFGHWAGLAVHDTSQVTATGFAYSQAAGETATVVKLTRNALMGPVIVLIAGWYLRARSAREPDAVRRASRVGLLTAVPPFVVGFLILALANSLGLIPDPAVRPLDEGARALILAALVGVGLNTDLSRLRGLGAGSLYLGLAAAALLSVLSALLILLIVPR